MRSISVIASSVRFSSMYPATRLIPALKSSGLAATRGSRITTARATSPAFRCAFAFERRAFPPTSKLFARRVPAELITGRPEAPSRPSMSWSALRSWPIRSACPSRKRMKPSRG